MEVREAQTPVMPVTVNKACGPDNIVMATFLTCMFSTKLGRVALLLTVISILAQSWDVVSYDRKYQEKYVCRMPQTFFFSVQFLIVDLTLAPVAIRTPIFCFCLSDIQYRIM